MTNIVAESARAFMEPLLTVEDLERLFRVDRRTVARLCQRGQIPPPLKLGGGNRWKANEITEAIDVLDFKRKSAGKSGQQSLTAV